MTIRDIYSLKSYEPTADESAEIKQVLKKEPISPKIVRLAATHFVEADEAVMEADVWPGSWAACHRDNIGG